MTQVKISKIAVLFILTTTMIAGGCTSQMVARGVQQGGLAACPSSPNCVSSGDTDEDRYIEPFQFKGSKQQAREHLIEVLGGLKNTKIVSDRNSYIRVEFKTDLMGFVDDGEFYVQDDQIHVRSAARSGYSDFGKNRKRMEMIRDAFEPCCS